MGFGEAVGSFYSRYFDFQTRSSRSEYWWPFLFQLLVYFTVGIIAGVVGFTDSIQDGNTDDIGINLVIILVSLGLFYLVNLIPGIAVGVRRFHDQDKSGWLYLLALIPYVGGIILIIFMCLDGTHGDNRFGPDPLGDNAYDTFN